MLLGQLRDRQLGLLVRNQEGATEGAKSKQSASPFLRHPQGLGGSPSRGSLSGSSHCRALEGGGGPDPVPSRSLSKLPPSRLLLENTTVTLPYPVHQRLHSTPKSDRSPPPRSTRSAAARWLAPLRATHAYRLTEALTTFSEHKKKPS